MASAPRRSGRSIKGAGLVGDMWRCYERFDEARHRMNLRWGRIAIAVVAAEILGVAVLAILVTLFGPPGFQAAMPFAERLGAWVGPISGFALCTMGGYWVARGAGPAALSNGVATGAAAAALDLAIGALLGGSINGLLVLSNVGRVIGGTIGGWLVSRATPRRSG
jgi:hypothetical protein